MIKIVILAGRGRHRGIQFNGNSFANSCRVFPATHTYQRDAETVYRLEEDEFFDLAEFSSRAVFLDYDLNRQGGYDVPWLP